MTQHVPEEHSSVVGGSTAARRIGCHASYRLEQLVPKGDPGGNAYAREGTALHEIMARVFSDGVEPTSLLPFTYTASEAKGGWSYTITEEIWEANGEPALAAFDEFCANEERRLDDQMQLVAETRVAFPGIPGAFGTTDVLGRCANRRYVIDWKFGYKPVAVDDNKQLKFYAVSALEDMDTPELEFLFPLDVNTEVVLVIIQPAVSKRALVWRTTLERLDRFKDELLLAVASAQLPDTKAVPGDWCTFARCKTVCPAHLGATTRLGEKLAEIDAARAATNSPNTLPVIDWPQRYAELLELAELAESLSSTVFAQAHEAAEGGMLIPGWTLDQKRAGARTWAIEEAEVRRRLGRLRLKADVYAPRKVITPAAAEKLLKPLGKVLPEAMVAPGVSSGTKLSRTEKAKKPQVAPSTRLAELGTKLQKLGGE